MRPGTAAALALLLHVTRAAALALLLQATTAAALVIDSTERARSERAPAPDPGWRNIGEREGRSAVYLGSGWVLTAEHVGAGPVVFEGKTYAPLPGSRVRLSTPGEPAGEADLIVFRVDPAPKLPALGLRKTPVRPGDPLVMVGFGRGRGDRTAWQGRPGFELRSGVIRRWGTNQAEAERFTLRARRSATRCFDTVFSPRGDGTEAQAAPGDSGGAVFARGAKLWRLAGIMIAIEYPLQPPRTAFFGNRTAIADLSFYRDQIRQIMGRRGSKARKRAGKKRKPEAEEPAAPVTAPDEASLP